MGHVAFIFLHLIVLLFWMPALVVTIPLHIIYGFMTASEWRKQVAEANEARMHVRCPQCRELVRRDAVKCKHCGAELTPQPIPEGPPPAAWPALIFFGVVIVALYLAGKHFFGR